MNVFISHKQEDEKAAAAVAISLRRNGHTCYLDLIDDNIGKNGDDLGDYIRRRLSECDSLIAVISDKTKGSWWVPWEIGVATEKDHPLSTYASDGATPPEYLLKWPVLKSLTEVDKFASLLASVLVRRQGMVRRGEVKSYADATKATTAEFHRDLKKAIGQV